MKNPFKHFYNLIYILSKFSFMLLVTVIGIFVLPLFNHRVKPFRTHSAFNNHKGLNYKDKYINYFFGNNDDGTEGDGPYLEKPFIKYLYSKGTVGIWFSRYIWSALRNPTHNLKQHFGMNEKIVQYDYIGRWDTSDRIGQEGFCYSEATGKSGKKYQMYYINFIYPGFKTLGFTANLGYKNFNVNPNNLPWYKPQGYSFTIAINPFKTFEP